MAASTFLAWRMLKRSIAATFSRGDERDFQLPQELSHGHPEIVADHENALQVRAVALAQGAEQIAVLNVLAAVQPLLKLIEHNQHLFSRAEDVPAAEALSVSVKSRE